MKTPEQKTLEKRITSWFFLVIGITSAGLGIWFGISEKDWLIFTIMCGFVIFFPLAIFGEPWIDKNRETFLKALETLGLLPKPTEAYMFVISVSMIILMLFSDIWRYVWYAVRADGRALVALLYVMLGIWYGIYFAFSTRDKTEFEQFVLKYYTAVFLSGLSIATAIYVYETKTVGYLVLTAWNGIQAIALFFLSGRDHVGEYIKLPTRDARRIELIIGAVLVASVLFMQKFIFKQHWVVAISAVLIAWSIVENIFQYSHNRAKEQRE